MNRTSQFLLVWVFLFLLPFTGVAQYGWQQLPAPSASNRFDDMSWRTPQLGWVIDFAGSMRKTTDGGQTWQMLPGPGGFAYRSVGFLTDQLGFVGKLMMGARPDTFVLYKTTNGGTSWAPVALPGPTRTAFRGFCGMSVVNDSVLVACGRYAGPAFFYRTNDAGRSWQVTDMRAYAGGLVDCYFWAPDSGIVVGCTGTFNQSNAIILGTTDGGQTWTERYRTHRPADLAWKITFPSRRIGYVSIQDFDGGDLHCLKTTDHGQTWQELMVAQNVVYNAEGIGFINEQVGWIGGEQFSPTVYVTVDGGRTWVLDTLYANLNRFRFFGDTLGYASGSFIYRITPRVLGLPSEATGNADVVGECLPNPTQGAFALPLTLRRTGRVVVRLTDALGREIRRREQWLTNGPQQVALAADGLQPGLYVVQVQTPGGQQTRRLVVP